LIGLTERRCLMPEQLTPEVIDQTPDVTLADVTDQDALLMEYAAILQAASQATADTLSQTFEALFPAMHAAALLDSEVEVILQAIKKGSGVSIRVLRPDWKKFVATHAQQITPRLTPLPPEAATAAAQLLQDPALLSRAITTIGQLGVEGEAVNRGVLYLALTSRLTADPASILIKGRSSSG